MKLTPINKKILIERVEPEKLKGGLILPSDADVEKPNIGTVVATDSDKVKEGDTVMFTAYGPVEIEFEKRKYLIASEDDILGIIK